MQHLRETIGQRRLLRRQTRGIDPYPRSRQLRQVRQVVRLVPDQTEELVHLMHQTGGRSAAAAMLLLINSHT